MIGYAIFRSYTYIFGSVYLYGSINTENGEENFIFPPYKKNMSLLPVKLHNQVLSGTSDLQLSFVMKENNSTTKYSLLNCMTYFSNSLTKPFTIYCFIFWQKINQPHSFYHLRIQCTWLFILKYWSWHFILGGYSVSSFYRLLLGFQSDMRHPGLFTGH